MGWKRGSAITPSMDIENKAVRIALGDFRSPQMRAFHLSWVAFFLCFFGWFGVAPLMAVVRDELSLTREQVGNTIIASVAATVLARLVLGWLCDRVGPRKTYSALLVLGALPVMGLGLATSYEAFLVGRLLIGAIGGSFVITQVHTSLMFAPNVVGTANATTAGWGNVGGGATQMVMPLVFAGLLALGVSSGLGWRLAMVVPGVLLVLTGVAYYFLTTDAPDGDFDELRAAGKLPPLTRESATAFLEVARDRRVWALFVIYAASFGVELTINNIAALYFHDRFELSVASAGLVAGLFGLMNLFARTLGGYLSDRAGMRSGLRGRVRFLGVALVGEAIALIVFSQMAGLGLAISAMLVFSTFVQLAEGATFSLVPMIDRKNLGVVAGIVGAGGNVGAVLAGFLFRSDALSTSDALLYLGFATAAASACVALVRFTADQESAAAKEMRSSLLAREAALGS